MNVVPKSLPEIEKDDKSYPMILWMITPEIVAIVLTNDKKLSLKDAKQLKGRVCYELADFRFQNVTHSNNRLYFGTAVYSPQNKLKILTTNKGKMYRIE